MAKKIAALLSRLARGILCPIPHVFVLSLVSGSIYDGSLEHYKTHLVVRGF
jgi:hypothetical protein